MESVEEDVIPAVVKRKKKKRNGLNPFRYLEFLLMKMMEYEEDSEKVKKRKNKKVLTSEHIFDKIILLSIQYLG